MPLQLEQIDTPPLCLGKRWQIRDRAILVDIVARLLLGEHIHARRIIERNTALPRTPTQGDIDKAIARLRVPAGQQPYHRDGWIMQLISWVAVYARSQTHCTVRAPQPRMADKGFDGLFVERPDGGLLTVTVCEDKATENPRDTFRDDVLPELKKFEAGHRDAELLNDLTSLLQTVPGLDVEAAIATLDWTQARRYRVALTVTTEGDSARARKALFDGYDGAAAGATDRRCGETFKLDPMRTWMEDFCSDVIEKLEHMRPNRRV